LSATEIKSLDELDSVLANSKRVLVDFHAIGWCVPCRRLVPHIDSLADKVEDVTFVKVDIDEVDGAKDRFEIMSVPTLYLFEDGEFSKNVIGRTSVQIKTELAAE
jgi:thioredoxin 1